MGIALSRGAFMMLDVSVVIASLNITLPIMTLHGVIGALVVAVVVSVDYGRCRDFPSLHDVLYHYKIVSLLRLRQQDLLPEQYLQARVVYYDGGFLCPIGILVRI